MPEAARYQCIERMQTEKEDVRRYCAALRRLRNAYRALDPAIKPWFSLAETAYVAGKATVIDRENRKG
jgi:hypothetical protein